MSKKLFLIDGHALIFKMYYAFLRHPMINSKGADMSILFGFTKYILELIEKEKPTHFAVAFDPPGGTFRHEMYPEYKGTRSETPQLVIDSLEPLTELCTAMGFPVLMIKGFEADDVIGSMAKRAEKEGFDKNGGTSHQKEQEGLILHFEFCILLWINPRLNDSFV
jgi:DNA polymerase-1